MPRRDTPQEEVVSVENKPGKYSSLINLDYLPEEYVKRIDDIFDAYFGLGMKSREDNIEESAPVFPTKVSTLSSMELGDTLAKYTAWFSYASDKHKYVIVATNFIENKMQSIIDENLGTMVSDKGNIEAKKAKARSSTEYVTLLAYFQKLDGLKTLLDREISQYDKCIASLSREVSRREHNAGY